MGEVIDQAHQASSGWRDAALAYSFLRHTGLSVSDLNPTPRPFFMASAWSLVWHTSPGAMRCRCVFLDVRRAGSVIVVPRGSRATVGLTNVDRTMGSPTLLYVGKVVHRVQSVGMIVPENPGGGQGLLINWRAPSAPTGVGKGGRVVQLRD